MKRTTLPYLWCLLISLLSAHASALEISSMFENVKQGSATFTVKNSGHDRIFLYVGMSKLEVVEKELKRTPYTKKNLEQWEISVRPAKTVIEPGFEKQITVNYQCRMECDSEKDKLFQLSVVPTPYVPEEQRKDQTVQVAVGFAPIVAVVNAESALSYKVVHKGDYVEFHNSGNSYFQAQMTSCEDRLTCQRSIKILAGRTLRFQLPERMAKQPLSIQLRSAFGEYQKTFALSTDDVVVQ